jgi:hypothetical protein
MKTLLDTANIEDYRLFLRVKKLPKYRFAGRVAEFPDEYSHLLGMDKALRRDNGVYTPPGWMYDYQGHITALAIRKRKFACFLECGLGKTHIMLEFARHAAAQIGDRKALIVSPLMVVRQTLGEAARFYGDTLPIEQLRASSLATWLSEPGEPGRNIGITNYEAIADGLPTNHLGALIPDESGNLKSHYGRWGTRLIQMAKGLQWKLCLTGTPAPNDRIEFANHAVFLDQFPNVNSFLARFFVNRGQTNERWELKAHALEAFYRSLSHWCIFLTNPKTYGWKDNAESIPPIHVHIHDVDMTTEQHEQVMALNGDMFGQAGGITSRAKLSQIAKGFYKGQRIGTKKPAYIKSLVDSWPDESTIIWCIYNQEQEDLEGVFPDAISIKGDTPYWRREQMIDDFKAGRKRILLSKAKVLGFGLNLQKCTRMVFSGLMDSWESFHQAVKRANRIGSSRALNVHIPITEVERPMIESVLRKANRIEADTIEQERIFKECLSV